MSHFSLLCLIPKTLEVKGAVAALLAPYDESIEVQEYEEDCSCVGEIARDAAVEQAERELGTVSSLRDRLWSEFPCKRAESKEYSEARDALWAKLVTPIDERRKALIDGHPMANKPDPACGDCQGSGKQTTTYNPHSKWDWWTIGGRWTGLLSGYKPDEDPRNFKTCWLCAGAGKRDDALGRAVRAQNPEYTCNGCNGTGRMLKFPTEFVQEGNIAPVSGILPLKPEQIPFAVLAPDGSWYERGEMGWFASVSGGKSEDAWTAEVADLLEKHRACLAVVVDCHT